MTFLDCIALVVVIHPVLLSTRILVCLLIFPLYDYDYYYYYYY